MAGEEKYEGQKIQWEKEKALLQSTIKEAGIQNGELQEKLEYHDTGGRIQIREQK